MPTIQHKQVLTYIPDGITIQDKDFNIIYQNAAMQKMFGRHLGEKCYAIYEHRDHVCERCGVQKAFKTKQPDMVVRTAIQEDGTTTYSENVCFPLFDDNGNIIAGAEICRNITDRVSLEEEVKDRNIQLGQLNKQLNQKTTQLQSSLVKREAVEQQLRTEIAERERTKKELQKSESELRAMLEKLQNAQAQMLQSEKLASIGQLAAGVAHEMNTPVGFVASNFETLQSYMVKFLDLFHMYEQLGMAVADGPMGQRMTILDEIRQMRESLQVDFILEDIQGLFNDSKEGLSRVTNIIQNLRDFSRIDQLGSSDEYNLNQGIEATLVVARNEIKYDTDVKTELMDIPQIFCHGGQINQVLLNVLVNAAQAIRSQERQDRGTITIRTYACEDGVACEIADDGPGITPEHLTRLFEPFFTTKPPGKGTGLGLSVSYDIIVHKHNGKFLVDSIPGQGAKFTIWLPIHQKQDDRKETANNGKENCVVCGR